MGDLSPQAEEEDYKFIRSSISWKLFIEHFSLRFVTLKSCLYLTAGQTLKKVPFLHLMLFISNLDTE